MPSLSETIARLSRLRATTGLPGGGMPGAADPGRLVPLTGFGSNPGALDGFTHVPDGLEEGAALVVVLHGCTQSAAGYDQGAGWSMLADRHGFALLFPQQRRANNPNGCFNWFTPEDMGRDAGEPLSIRQMIDAVVAEHGIDPRRIFVTGLSAGGAMTAVMLATYPELFAGGAVIAGLPFGSARGIPQALERMRGAGLGGAAEGAALAATVRAASRHDGRWPTMSVWHGTADATVHPDNGTALVAQWRALHGLNEAPTRSDTIDGHPHRVWADAAGRVAVEEYRIAGLGHGTPLATGGDAPCGVAGAYMLEAGISSTRHIAAAWGLTDVARHDASPTRADAEAASPPHVPPRALEMAAAAEIPRHNPDLHRLDPAPTHAAAGGVGQVIEDALRKAGLMR